MIQIDDPRVGPMTQVGPLVFMSETPAIIKNPAPIPGQHTAEVLAEPTRQRSGQAIGGDPQQPLEGIVMLELASWLASPLAGALLADLGAQVIKIEPLTGDPWRTRTGGQNQDPRAPTNENLIRVMQGKQSIAVDLKTKDQPRNLARVDLKGRPLDA